MRGSPSRTNDFVRFFAKLLPDSMHHLICIDSDRYQTPTECRILTVSPSIAVPQPSENIFRIEFLDNCDDVHVKWLGCLPNKCK